MTRTQIHNPVSRQRLERAVRSAGGRDRRQRPVARIDALECRRLFAAGDFDLSFSGDGKFGFNLPVGFEIYDTAIAADGKIVVAGDKGNNIAVARLNPDGTLDTSFGIGGVFESSRRGHVSSVAVQGDYKIVLGLGDGLDLFDMQVGRLLANGSDFDTSFGGLGGIASVGDEWDTSIVHDVAVQRDGKIVAAGGVDDGLIFPAYDAAVVRYDANGQLDSSFGGGDGVSQHGFGTDFEEAVAMALDYNGNIDTNPWYGSIVAGVTSLDDPSRFRLLRLRPDGSADSAFDGDGKLTSPDLSGAGREILSSVVAQPGGKIVACGSAVAADPSFQNFLISRYNSNGSLDTTFGLEPGNTELGFGGTDTGGAITTGYLGGLLVCGTSDGFLTVLALRADGQVDTRFSGDGILNTGIYVQTPGIAVHNPGLAVTTNLIAPIRKLVIAGGNGQVARLIDVGSVVSVGTFQPNAYEQGPTATTFIVGRTEVLPFAENIFIGTGGVAYPPLTIGNPRDYNGTNISFGNGQTSSTFVTIPAGASFTTVTITPVDDTNVEGDEPATFRVIPTNVYDASATNLTSLMIRDNDLVGGPTVMANEFNYQTSPIQVSFRFSVDVAASIGANDFQITGPPGIPSTVFNYSPVTNTATLTFGENLPDGNYIARAIASGITNAAGTPMPADQLLTFHSLAGDANRDRKVDVADLGVLASNWQQSGRTFAQGDFDYNGVVDVGDLGILASHWQQQLTSPSAPFADLRSTPSRAGAQRLIEQVL